MIERPNSAAAMDIASHLHPYTNARKHETEGPMVITEGKGIFVYDDQGKEYIEGLAGLWSTALGFGEERLVEAAAAEMRKLPFYHTFAHKSHDVGIELAERLIEMAPVPMSKAFFTNSGSEANDTVVKMVWYYNNALGRPEKKKIISRIKAYHGVTVAAASLTGLPVNHRAFDLPIAVEGGPGLDLVGRHGPVGGAAHELVDVSVDHIVYGIGAAGRQRSTDEGGKHEPGPRPTPFRQQHGGHRSHE